VVALGFEASIILSVGLGRMLLGDLPERPPLGRPSDAAAAT
jgi:hypothetical protein